MEIAALHIRSTRNDMWGVIAEVTGSSPVPPIIASVLSEELLLRELLEAVLGPEGRRRLMLRHLNNDNLFEL